jgi:hypothetical protein
VESTPFELVGDLVFGYRVHDSTDRRDNDSNDNDRDRKDNDSNDSDDSRSRWRHP